MSKDLVTMTIEIDIEVYNKAAELFENLGTTIEDMTVGFLRFCVIPENLPLLKAYLGIENAPAEAGAGMKLHHGIFQQVFHIAAENTGQLVENVCLRLVNAIDPLFVHLNVAQIHAGLLCKLCLR